MAWLSRLLPWRNRARDEEELSEELRFHFEMQVEKLRREGLNTADAKTAARRELGSMMAAAERTRETRPFAALESWWQDLLHGQKLLWRTRRSSMVTFFVLAIGIAAVTLVFSATKAVLFDPPPFANPDRLMVVYGRSHTYNTRTFESYPDLADIAERSTQVEAVAAYPGFAMQTTTVNSAGNPVNTKTTVVSSNFFSTLGVNPLRGRYFDESADSQGSNYVAVVSEGFWRSELGAAESAIGQPLRVDGNLFTVIGVMPASFRLPSEAQEVWVPLSTLEQDSVPWKRRPVRWMKGIARLKRGVLREQAQAELSGIAERLAEEFPDSNRGWKSIELQPLQEELIGTNRAPLLMVLVAITLLFLLALVNLSSLMIGRTVARQQDLAVRTALGASRWRVLRQLLLEHAAVCGWAAAVGVFLAWMGFRFLQSQPLPGFERMTTSNWDAFTLLVPAAILVLAPVLLSIGPAFHVTRRGFAGAIAALGMRGGSSGGGLRAQRWLIAGEVTIAIVLCVGASLFALSVQRLLQVDPGFKPENTLLVELRLPGWKGDKEVYLGVLERILSGIREIPGVESAGSVKYAPLTELDEDTVIVPPGFDTSKPPPSPSLRPVTPGYFAAMGIPILHGRDYTEADREGPTSIILSEGFVKEYAHGENLVGREVTVGSATGPKLRVIGIVGDVRSRRLEMPPQPAIYPYVWQVPRVHAAIAVRTKGQPLSFAEAVRKAIQNADKEQAIERITTMEAVVGRSSFSQRLLASLLLLFAVSGLAIAALGTYGTVANFLSHRTRELGIRLALGALPREVFRLLMRTALGPVVVGVVLGVSAGAAGGKLVESQLYQVTAGSPTAFAIAAGVILLASLLAAGLAARRSQRLDPATILRDQ